VGWFHELIGAVTECQRARSEAAARELARLGVRLEYDTIDIMLHRRRHLALGAFTLLLIAAESGFDEAVRTLNERLTGLGWFITLAGYGGRSARGRAAGRGRRRRSLLQG
jgi:hypothetical protein